ncbi:helix-turn-helix transcriptional regulator [Actinacidiphila acididurans]|uniref:HTH luxR-type domain-containing protein n=1 Tax=Actinacidiphila acididurans TaxID=2784346 RepID=A0ABS2TW32_9ACTN|nr:helix-turn-helix transcriptional regulator [Actinacidiphila acididurans]MBM9507549.1 hypothetical protein [Actinacidiphila acididurans]
MTSTRLTRPAARDALAGDLTRRLSGTAGCGPLDVLRTAASVLLAAVPADVWCAVMFDPATLLDTGGLHEHGFPDEVMPRLFEIEHAEQAGADNIRALARRASPVSLLSRSAGPDLTGNVYYRDVLRPAGLADELRVLLRDGRRAWGLLALCREAGAPPFTAADVDLAAAAVAPTTTALRRSLLVSGAAADDGEVPDAAGLVVLDDDRRVRMSTSTAERWLGLVQEARAGGDAGHPRALGALAGRARTAGPGVQVRSRALTRTGQWVTLSGWREKAGAEELTYVALTPSTPGELTAIVLDAYGLTPRERDVAQRVLLGRSTAEVAAELHIAEYTVQDHLRKVFDKAGVRSRREFSGELFRRCYLPRLADPPLTTDGRLRTRAG